MVHVHGDPVKWSFYGALTASTQSLTLIVPGTSTAYPFATTDYLYLTSYMAVGLATETGGAAWAITSLGPGSTSTGNFSAATVLLVGGGLTSGVHNWVDASFSESIAGVQGVIPTIIGLNDTQSTIVVGSGFVVHAPGTTRPSFLNSTVPTG
jgi:hypothetical protein